MNIKKNLIVIGLTLLGFLGNIAEAENDPPIPFDIVAVFGHGETGKTANKNYLDGAATTIVTPGKVYIVPGKDKTGANKNYRVLLGDTQAELATGLSTTGCAVVFDGHCNYGIGPAFNSAAITQLSDYMNIGTSTTPIVWADETQQYPNLTIANADIAGDVTNRTIAVLDQTNKLRFANSDGVGDGGTFHKTGTGTGQYHLNNGPERRVIVNAGAADLPTLRYDCFFYNACNSGRNYIEVLTHGTLIYTTDLCSSPTTSKIFVEKTIAGKTSDEILTAINAVEDVNKKITR